MKSQTEVEEVTSRTDDSECGILLGIDVVTFMLIPSRYIEAAARPAWRDILALEYLQ
jgi:hypothetical protein